MRAAARSKIAATSLAVSTAVAGVFSPNHEAEAAKKPIAHASHHDKSSGKAIHKSPEKPHKIHYQQFPQGNAKLEKIEGKELEKYIGRPGVAECLSPLDKDDIAQIQKLCEFHDPWKTGLPLVRITQKDLEKTVSRHFKVKDLVRIDPKDHYLVKPGFSQMHQGEYFRTIARIDPDLIQMLEQVEKELQPKQKKQKKGSHKAPAAPYKHLHTNEGFRPWGENARTYWRDCHGNAACTHEKSQHVSGMGTDIDIVPGLQSAAMKVVKKRGAGGVGMHGASIVHLDSRRGKMAFWGYGSAPHKNYTPKKFCPKKP